LALKNRNIAAFGYVNTQGIRAPLCLVVLSELRPQSPGLHSYDRVHAGVKGRSSIENFDSNYILFELILPAFDGPFHHKAEKPAQPLGVHEGLTLQNLVQLL